MDENTQSKVIAIIRVFTGAGCLLFLCLAIKMGAAAVQARSAHALMSNWKNGLMTYEAGFGVTGIFALFAIIYGYCFVSPKSLIDSWNRSKNRKRA